VPIRSAHRAASPTIYACADELSLLSTGGSIRFLIRVAPSFSTHQPFVELEGRRLAVGMFASGSGFSPCTLRLDLVGSRQMICASPAILMVCRGATRLVADCIGERCGSPALVFYSNPATFTPRRLDLPLSGAAKMSKTDSGCHHGCPIYEQCIVHRPIRKRIRRGFVAPTCYSEIPCPCGCQPVGGLVMALKCYAASGFVYGSGDHLVCTV